MVPSISNTYLTFSPKFYGEENVLFLNEYRQAFSKGAHEVAMEHGAENLGKPRDKRDLRKVSKKKPGKLAVKDSMKKVGKRMMKKEMKKIPKKGETWPKVRRITDSEGKLIK